MNSEEKKGGKNKAVIIGGLFVLFLIIGIIGFYMNSQQTDSDSSNQLTPGPPPSGPAPPGKGLVL